jgi:hypothetical protein
MTSRIAQLTVVDCLFVVLAQRDLPATEAALERTYAAAQAKRTRRARRVPAEPPAAPEPGVLSLTCAPGPGAHGAPCWRVAAHGEARRSAAPYAVFFHLLARHVG